MHMMIIILILLILLWCKACDGSHVNDGQANLATASAIAWKLSKFHLGSSGVSGHNSGQGQCWARISSSGEVWWRSGHFCMNVSLSEIILSCNLHFLQVFEDALEDIVVEEEEAVTVNNNTTCKKSPRSFKLKRSKSKKHESVDGEEISLEQGLEEGQQAIDLFFDNRFAESREIAQKQWVEPRPIMK